MVSFRGTVAVLCADPDTECLSGQQTPEQPAMRATARIAAIAAAGSGLIVVTGCDGV